MKNKKVWIVVGCIILLLLLTIIFLLLNKPKGFTIVLDTNGGVPLSNIVVKDGEIVKLPEKPVKEGYKFSGWVNEDNKVITSGTKITEDITLKAMWIDESVDTITTTFDTDGGNVIGDIVFAKDSVITLPVLPIKEGYIFAGWVNEEGNIVTNGIMASENIILKALWIDKNAEIVTATFDTDGGNIIDNIIIEKGLIIKLPVLPSKVGYVFAGWVDQDGNPITKDSIVNANITLKAIWKMPYTCPNNCTPEGDGSTCSKIVTKDHVDGYSCPNGYKLIDNKCLDTTTQYMAESVGYCEDGSTTNGDCDKFKYAASSESECKEKQYYSKGYCVPYANWVWECKSGYTDYVEVEGLGATVWCAKSSSKETIKKCPKGYYENNGVCEKTEHVKCSAN